MCSWFSIHWKSCSNEVETDTEGQVEQAGYREQPTETNEMSGVGLNASIDRMQVIQDVALTSVHENWSQIMENRRRRSESS